MCPQVNFFCGKKLLGAPGIATRSILTYKKLDWMSRQVLLSESSDVHLRSKDFIPQNLGNTAWAYNRLGYRDEQLMQCPLG